MDLNGIELADFWDLTWFLNVFDVAKAKQARIGIQLIQASKSEGILST